MQYAVQYGFHFNARRCTGCRACVLACKDYRDLPEDMAFRQVYEFVGGGWHHGAEKAETSAGSGGVSTAGGSLTQDCFAYYVSVACNHCTSPACVDVCPTGAMHKEENGGFVDVDTMRCIGCGYCALACPYRAPKVDRSKGHSAKCDGCRDRVAQGKKPVCVEACPMRALDFAPIEELAGQYGTFASLPPLPDSLETLPSLVITPPACADNDPSLARLRTGRVANRRDIVSEL